jgi:hypothetical protein
MESTPSPTPANAAPVHVPRRGCGSVFAGIVLVLIGIPMLVCPGPGMASIAAGIGMIAVGLDLHRRGTS